MKEQLDIMEAFSAEVKEKEQRYRSFNLPLADELYLLAADTIPALKTISTDKKKELYMRAFFRVGELCNFMMERIYDDEHDEQIDTTQLTVPAQETTDESSTTQLLYSAFNLAKKKLWIAFPEMSEFSGNSILFMNRYAFDCMARFRKNVEDILA